MVASIGATLTAGLHQPFQRDPRVAGGAIGIMVYGQHDEAVRRGLRQRPDPAGVERNVGPGKPGLGHAVANRPVKPLPLRDEGGDIIAARPHRRPLAEAVGLVADLQSEKLGADRIGDIGRLGGGIFRGAAREVEPVDELPVERAQEQGETIDRSGGDEEILPGHLGRRWAPDGALAGIAADPQHAA
jgi:hypothetical protein